MLNVSKQGAFVTNSKAKTYVQSYLSEKGPAATQSDHVFGFVFSLDNVRELVKKIDAFNATQKDADKYTGLRIYLAKSTRASGKTYRDLVITPVKANGQDTINPLSTAKTLVVAAADDDGGINLSDSGPCPNVCE